MYAKGEEARITRVQMMGHACWISIVVYVFVIVWSLDLSNAQSAFNSNFMPFSFEIEVIVLVIYVKLRTFCCFFSNPAVKVIRRTLGEIEDSGSLKEDKSLVM